MYNVFLMIELARLKGIIHKELEYDLTWELGEALIVEYNQSKFFKVGKGLYECISDFLDDKIKGL